MKWPTLAGFAVAAVLSSRPVLADEPTIPACLAASDASLELDNNHKLRAERAQLVICAAASCPADVRKECVRRVEELNGQIPSVVFEAKEASGADLSAVKVTMDGETLAERLYGAPIAVDPGPHAFTFDTLGQPSVTKNLVIQQGVKDRREAVVFGAAPPPAASAPTRGLGTQRIVALAAGGVGLVGLGLGTAFGVLALSQKSDAMNVCPNTACPTHDGVTKWSDAATSGTVSTVGFVLGGLGIAGAAVLWFTAPSRRGGASAPSAQVGLAPDGLRLRGAW